MKIDKIGTAANYRALSPAKQKSPAFTGGLASLEEMITKNLPQRSLIKKMKSLEWLNGEVGGIILTALGTGLVAPIFIGANPFVKAPEGATEDQKKEVVNTKWYTAMRQPISAVLAILFQVGAQKPINRFLDEIFNDKVNAEKVNLHMSQSDLNSKTYLETQVKKEMGKKPSWLKGFSEGFAEIGKQRKDYDEKFNAKVKTMGENQLNALVDHFQQNGEIKIGKRHLDEKTLAELVNKQIDKYISDAKEFRINDEGLTFYTQRSQTLVNNEEHLRKIFKDLPEDEKSLESKLKNLLSGEKKPEVKNLIQEILDRPSELRRSRIDRTLERIDCIKDMCPDGKYTPTAYLNAMSKRNDELDRMIVKLRMDKIADTKSATKEIIIDAIKKIRDNCLFNGKDRQMNSILHDTDTFMEKGMSDKLLKKIHKDITNGYKKLLENKYKSFNQISKVLVGVFITLPITCTALNWVYPRFMNIFFPHLAGVKNGGDK